MKVKVTNAPVSFWYNDKIGQVFEVEDKPIFEAYCVVGEHLHIMKDDCVIIEEG